MIQGAEALAARREASRKTSPLIFPEPGGLTSLLSCPAHPHAGTRQFKIQAAALTRLHFKTRVRPGWPNKSLWDNTTGPVHPSLLSSVEDEMPFLSGAPVT